MPDADKNEARYIGNKVRVKVNRSSPGPRAGGAARKSAKKTGPADPASPDMLQPVDYQPPDEKKLKSIREEGLREGRELVRGAGPGKAGEAAGKTAGEAAGKAAGEAVGKAAGEAAGKAAEKAEGEYIGQKDRAPGKQAPAAAVKRAGTEQPVRPENETYYAPAEREKEGKDNEGTDRDTEKPAQAQVQTAERSQRKGRKKKKAEQKAERKAAERAYFGADGHTGGEKVGKADQKGAVSPELSGQDKLIVSGKDRPRPTVPRAVVMALSGLFMLYALSPLAVGVVTVGILPPLCIGAFFFTVAYFWPKICACKKPWFNTLFTLCGLAVIAGITLIFYLFGLMYAASAVKPPPNRSDYTVVVLGCKTIDNRPSLMLGDRLDAAAEFLKAHPGAYCIVSGGQGDDELEPESAVMKRYLVSKGISELRIVEERSSTSTAENIENSCALLDECNLYDDIVIVTDRFHQYRARHFVEKRGLRCYAVNSETRWYLAIHYWFKEMVAVGLIQLGYEIN